MPLALILQSPGATPPDIRTMFLVGLSVIAVVAVFATVLIGLLLRRRYQRTLELQKMAVMGSTTARILHQVKNPVQSLLLQAELLEEFERDDLPELRREASGAIVAEAHRLAAMLAELSTWASGSRRAMSPERISVRDLLGGLVRQESREANRLGVQIEFDAPADAVASIDVYFFRQAVENLLRNAREALHGRPGARIRVKVEREGTRVAIRVVDNGPGIPPERLADIFEPFVTSKGGGMGLGLPIARELVEAHGGEIGVDSAVGVGTTFTITVPAAAAEVETATLQPRGAR